MRKLLPIVLVLFALVGCGDSAEPDATEELNATAELIQKAEQGHAEAQYNLGLKYSKGEGVLKDDKEAVKWYLLAAVQGDADAQNNLGLKYANGEGVPQDWKEAVKWWRMAAEQGHAWAQVELGYTYKKGTRGVPQNFKEAVKWWRKAAAQGFAEAQRGLGYAYENGEGVLKDFVAAYAWLNLAAYNGDEDAPKSRDALATEMTPEQIAEAQDMAKALLKKIEANKAAKE